MLIWPSHSRWQLLIQTHAAKAPSSRVPVFVGFGSNLPLLAFFWRNLLFGSEGWPFSRVCWRKAICPRSSVETQIGARARKGKKAGKQKCQALSLSAHRKGGICPPSSQLRRQKQRQKQRPSVEDRSPRRG